MDKPMRDAFGFPKAKLWANLSVEVGLWLRKKALRFLPPRLKPYRLPPTRTYPDGYDMQMLGPMHAK